jgi:hypothetical protein
MAFRWHQFTGLSIIVNVANVYTVFALHALNEGPQKSQRSTQDNGLT